VQQMLEVVEPYKAQGDEADIDQLSKEVKAVLAPNVDFPYISRWVMGKYARKASDEQKQQFAGVFEHTLIKTYGKTLLGFDIESYKLVPAKKKSPKPNKQVVTVEVKSSQGKKYVLVNYMVKKEGSWKLVNAVLGGLNLRLTSKNQFAKLAQDNKSDVGLVSDQWASKIDAPQ